MIARAHTAVLLGVDATIGDVEVDVGGGLAQIAAQPSLAFSLSADGNLTGALNANALLNFDVTADLQAQGALQAQPSMTITSSADLLARGGLLATALLSFTVNALLFDSSARRIPNSVQDLLVSLFNSFQALQVQGPNSTQTIVVD